MKDKNESRREAGGFSSKSAKISGRKTFATADTAKSRRF